MKTTLPLLLKNALYVFYVIVLSATFSAPARAENKKKEQAIIVELSPMEMVVSRGGDAVHVTYKIPKNPIVTFEGLPATVSDLRAGMMVTVRPDESGQVALAIRAHKAPRNH